MSTKQESKTTVSHLPEHGPIDENGREILLQVKNVDITFGKGDDAVKAVKNASFDIYKGETFSLVGESGSGKTTLLNMMAAIDHVTSGHIYYDDLDITEMSADQLSEFRKENLGFVFQEYNLLDTLTLEENIILALTVQGKRRKEIQKICQDMMELLEIEDVKDQFPYEVSGGQKQRCACARAMANDPSLLLADEPTGALDSHASQVLLETFCRLNEMQKATILMVTHDAFSASYCSRILFLRDGKIFHELIRGERNRRAFLQEILDVLSLMGGESSHDTKTGLS